MATHLIIDGYNLTSAESRGGGPGVDHLGHTDLEGARERLLERLKVYKKVRRVRVTVVFDGTGTGDRTGENRSGIRVLYSRGGEDADTVIKELVKGQSGPTVVTSDASVASYAEAQGAVAVKADEFLDLLYMAEYEEVKGVSAEDEEYEPGTSRKKGPARRPSKDKRKKINRLKKL